MGIMSWSSDLDDPGIVFPHFMNYITSKYDENRISKSSTTIKRN